MHVDYLVLGSGLAGLSFAALAAHRGRRVVVVEAHEHPGGYGHTFSYGKAPKEYRFNAQLHYVWNCGPEQTVGRFLRKLDLDREVTFEPLDPLAFDRMRLPGLALDVPYDRELLIERLVALFPAHADACRGFVREVFAVADELDRFPTGLGPLAFASRLHQLRRVIRWRNATLGEVFSHFRLPAEARALLALQWPDFMLPPRDLSFFAWVMLFVGYTRGASYPTRHFEHVVDSLVRRVRESGGAVRTCHRVTGFVLEAGRVVGAEIEEVDADGAAVGPRFTQRAAHVVCNMDPRRAAEMIGLDRFSAPVRRRLDAQPSVSNFMAYCAVEGLDLEARGFGRNNLFHAEHPDLDATFDDMVLRGDYRRPSFAVSVPSLLTPVRTDCPPGQHIVEILTAADYSRWQTLKNASARAYADAKKAVFERICEVIERDHLPGFRDHLTLKLLGSPSTNQRYAGAPQGGSYGAALIPSQMGPGRLGADSSIPGLSFCSATAGYPGFAGTIWTGSTLYGRLESDRFLP
ncbi:MAG TPA: NAD(P)/FAD-dependent oxidoreductase [Myxococcota bacterium]|nr:NAD(P)/FAD-dependent oxidoreductase [Myxococcota bacterium]